MTNITMAIEDELLERARALVARKGTTLNAFVREQIAAAVEAEDRRAQARLELQEVERKINRKAWPQLQVQQGRTV